MRQRNLKEVDLPPAYKITIAAESISKHISGKRVPVFLGGYGAFRDWNGGVGNIYKQYNPNLATIVPLNQDDEEKWGVRAVSTIPKLTYNPNDELLFESSIKESNSPSLLGQLICLLLYTDGKIWTSSTQDYWGISHFPIEPEYLKKGRPYIGTKRLLLKNKKTVKQFVGKFVLPYLLASDDDAKERANRILSDYEKYLEDRIGELLPSDNERYVDFLDKVLMVGQSV